MAINFACYCDFKVLKVAPFKLSASPKCLLASLMISATNNKVWEISIRLLGTEVSCHLHVAKLGYIWHPLVDMGSKCVVVKRSKR